MTDLKTYTVTVSMLKMEESTLEESVDVQATSQEEAEGIIESMGPIAFEEENSFHGHWQYSCLNDQEFVSVSAGEAWEDDE